ncbi:MAG: trypsin-like peptidase domain-containing protein, partial [Candidatus Rokubacteria bacterium]|nr:trypsin-like peptidase domain-containing protein [Candidatus Rokubacteria bacterium]
MRAVLLGLLLMGTGLAGAREAAALSVQEAILLAKPAVALVTAEVRAEVTMNCGQGPVAVSPAPFVETGTGWFVDGRGWLVTNAHVVDPAHRLPAWVTHELKKKAIEQACVGPALRARGLMRGQRPDVEETIRRQASDLALASAKVVPQPQVTVLLSNGTKLRAEIKKFSPPLLLDNSGRPLQDSGRDLALLRVKDGVYPAIGLATREGKIGDPVHILGFPGVVLT